MDDPSTTPGVMPQSDPSAPGGADLDAARNGESKTAHVPPARAITSKRIVIPPGARRRPAPVEARPAAAAPPTPPAAPPPTRALDSAPQETTPPLVELPAAPAELPPTVHAIEPADAEIPATTQPPTPPPPQARSSPPIALTPLEPEAAALSEPPAESSSSPNGDLAADTGIKPAPFTPARSRAQTATSALPPAAAGIKPTALPYQLNEASLAPVQDAPRRRRGLEFILWALAAILLVVAIIAIIPVFLPNLLPSLTGGSAPAPTTTAIVLVAPTALPSSTSTLLPTQGATVANQPVATLAPLVIPTPPADGTQFSLLPEPNFSGWYASGEADPHYGDANLHAGTFQGKTFSSIIQYNLRNQPTDSKILFAALEMTGRDAGRLGSGGQWQLELVQDNLNTDWANASPALLAQAKSLGTLGTLQASNLAAGQINRFILDDSARQLLAQQFKNGRAVLRLRGPEGSGDNLFTWESGTGGSALIAPTLHLVVVPGKYAIVTNTPAPKNVLTAAAYVVRGTDAAKRNGTPTSFPPGVATATPGGEIVEVGAETAIPGNDATAIAQAQLATAIARTTGTYTPTPRGVVIIFPTATPVVINPNSLSTATPIPPDADLLQIPFDYSKCQCQGYIMLLSNRYGGKDLSPILVQPDGTAIGKLSGDLYYRLALARESYSPDRTKRLIYPQNSNGVQQVGYQDVATGAITFITNFPKGVAYDAVWSPDGNSIAYVSTERGNTDEIYVYDFGTGQSTRITDSVELGQPWSKHPSWSPDSQQIVFWSSRSGSVQIWVMNRDGTNLRNISNNAFTERDPVWIK